MESTAGLLASNPASTLALEVNYLTPLGPSFLIYNTGIIIVPNSQSCYEYEKVGVLSAKHRASGKGMTTANNYRELTV